MKPKWKKNRFYEILWDDIIADQGWVNEEGETTQPAKCISYGWLSDLKTGKAGYIRISATMGDNGDGSLPEYNQHIVIPLGCITAVKEIIMSELKT